MLHQRRAGGRAYAPMRDWLSTQVSLRATAGQPPVQAAASDAWIAPARSMQSVRHLTTTDPAWGGSRLLCRARAISGAGKYCRKASSTTRIRPACTSRGLGIVAESETANRISRFGTARSAAASACLRYGTNDMIFPQGWELDVEAAAMVRLTFDEIRDFETADYRVGIPLTYGIDNWQFKFAVYHLSSHLGDEFAIAHPGSLDDRINYVRDALVLGALVLPAAVHAALRRSRLVLPLRWRRRTVGIPIRHRAFEAGSDRLQGTPFLAINGHLREDVDFGGDINTERLAVAQRTGQVMRAGVQYFNGKSSQYQTFNQFEQQIGFGLWYDF